MHICIAQELKTAYFKDGTDFDACVCANNKSVSRVKSDFVSLRIFYQSLFAKLNFYAPKIFFRKT